jgi:broad specificity phosphatase PhoE
MRVFVASAAVERVGEVWSSPETKAIEAAGLLAARFGLPVHVHEGLGENDRSSTGFRPAEAFNALVDAFFARPTESVQGWETAIAAQRRITGAMNTILAQRLGIGDVAIVGHGCVGTLLLCALTGAPISRSRDQPSPGHFWSYDVETRLLLHGWQAIS